MKFTKEEKHNIIVCVQFAKKQMEKLLIKELCPVKEIDNMLDRCSDLKILLDKLYKW